MPRYVSNHWSIRLARLAYRFERATDTAIELVANEDCASWHFEGRSLTWSEELPTWCAGFKAGWLAAGSDGHPWFERTDALLAIAADGER